MSLLTYRGIQLQIVHTRQIRRAALTSRDGLAYHATQWTFDCDCVFNPQATSYQFRGPTTSFNGMPVAPNNSLAPLAVVGAGAALATPGALPVFTDASLRHWLSQPRGQLVYAVGGVIQLACPSPGYSCDVAGGPNVTVNDVLYLFENRTFVVSLKIVATVNEARQRVSGAALPHLGFPLLLSNRWRQYVSTDNDYFATLVTQGEALFRLDELSKRGATADQYRTVIAPECPVNFHRGDMTWTVTEDGAKLLYQVEDQELAFNTPKSFGATRVEAYETRQEVEPNAASALQVGMSYLLTPSPAPLGEYEARVAARGRRQAAIAGAFNTGISIGRAITPVIVTSCLARAWGNRDSSRPLLANLVIGICFGRVGAPGAGFSTQARLMVDVAGKMAEFEVSHTFVWWPNAINVWNAAQVATTSDGSVAQEPIHIVTRMRNNDDTPGYLVRNQPQNLQPPNSLTRHGSGARGTWQGTLQTQTIPTADALPDAPPAEEPITEQSL